jgi:23S rRNA (pseudouridine1915-N3)-methyltransferase
LIIKILSVGKVRMPFIKEGEAEYQKRLAASPYRLERIEIDAVQAMGKNFAAAQLAEADKTLARLHPGDFLVVLDERGKQMSSQNLALWLGNHAQQGTKTIVFAIGGAWGWHSSIYERANLRWSLSELTYPYQLTRLILIEQLYRAHSILQGTPYHRE